MAHKCDASGSKGESSKTEHANSANWESGSWDETATEKSPARNSDFVFYFFNSIKFKICINILNCSIVGQDKWLKQAFLFCSEFRTGIRSAADLTSPAFLQRLFCTWTWIMEWYFAGLKTSLNALEADKLCAKLRLVNFYFRRGSQKGKVFWYFAKKLVS